MALTHTGRPLPGGWAAWAPRSSGGSTHAARLLSSDRRPASERTRRGIRTGAGTEQQAAAASAEAAQPAGVGAGQPPAAAVPAPAAAAAVGVQPSAAAAAQHCEPPLDPTHVLIEDGFLPAHTAKEMRSHFEEKMVLDQLRPPAQRPVWDSWGWGTPPEELRVMRTPADDFFPAKLHAQLRQRLESFGRQRLGCASVSPVRLSYYVEGCWHGWQCAAPTEGLMAFVLSLTRWEGRGFDGGETMLLQPNPFETDETSLIAPEFNRLLLFDPRLAYGVCRVQGTHDPLDARVVLVGWFAPPTLLVEGSLGEEQVAAVVAQLQAELHAALGSPPPATGFVVVRLEVEGGSGRVTALRWLVNTLMAPPDGMEPPWALVDAVAAAICERCSAALFPRSADGGGTAITIPFTWT